MMFIFFNIFVIKPFLHISDMLTCGGKNFSVPKQMFDTFESTVNS